MTAVEVKKYYPALPDITYKGNFVQVVMQPVMNNHRHRYIYLYSFEETHSCSDYGEYHALLPKPVEKM